MRIAKPQGDLRSLTWKARTKAARRLMEGSPDEYEGDDFDWSRYHLEYSEQLAELETINTLRLVAGQFVINDGSVDVLHGLPLHANHKALYETVLTLNPTSVLEAGCGGGDHLHNLALLLPHAQIRGVDRSPGQLRVLRDRNAAMADATEVVDLTLPHPVGMERADVVFAQAVLMHIQTGNGHRVALWNLFALANNQVLLMENPHRHRLVDDIVDLHRRRILPWDDLLLYTRSVNQSPPVLVASRTPLGDSFQPLG